MGEGSRDGEEPSHDDLFADDAAGPAEPCVEHVSLSDKDCEELEIEERCRVLPTPGNPTSSQREDHSASGHLPYRAWCEECVAARATGEQHRRRTERRTVCVLAFEYLFLDKSGIVL